MLNVTPAVPRRSRVILASPPSIIVITSLQTQLLPRAEERHGQDVGLWMNNSLPGNKISSLRIHQRLASAAGSGAGKEPGRCRAAGAGGVPHGWDWGDAPCGGHLSTTPCFVSWVTSLNLPGYCSPQTGIIFLFPFPALLLGRTENGMSLAVHGGPQHPLSALPTAMVGVSAPKSPFQPRGFLFQLVLGQD